ncbi:hypothetical protein EIP86_007089 [Pleurotus ostreatoroseus]|nr:hypothetical protein EIP86_007089 [Pleurotus ostreatoroseus]
MQKDEEVGKVAQATPVVISKALELFLGVIVDEASKVTLERGSKKVEAYHLKHAVETVETLDFLKEIVAAVPDPSAGGTVDLVAEAQEKAAAKKRTKGKKPAELGEDGEPKVPARKRRRKDDGDGVVKEKGKGRGKAKAKQQDVDMDEKPVDRDEDQDYENGDSYPAAPDDDDEWES